jgi:hypothetical protein
MLVLTNSNLKNVQYLSELDTSAGTHRTSDMKDTLRGRWYHIFGHQPQESRDKKHRRRTTVGRILNTSNDTQGQWTDPSALRNGSEQGCRAGLQLIVRHAYRWYWVEGSFIARSRGFANFHFRPDQTSHYDQAYKPNVSWTDGTPRSSKATLSLPMNAV